MSDNNINRQKQIQITQSTFNNLKIDLYLLDQTIKNFIINIIQPKVNISQQKQMSVPVIYGDGQRWVYATKHQSIRDKNGQLLSPVIMFKRTDIQRRDNLQFPKLNLDNPYFNYTIKQVISPQNSSNTQPVNIKKQYRMVFPQFIDVSYNFIMWTDYISQMNKLIQNFLYYSNQYWGDDRFKFLSNIDSFSNNVQVGSVQKRIVKCQFSLTLKGHVIPELFNKQQKTISYSKNKLKINQKVVQINDIYNNSNRDILLNQVINVKK